MRLDRVVLNLPMLCRVAANWCTHHPNYRMDSSRWCVHLIVCTSDTHLSLEPVTGSYTTLALSQLNPTDADTVYLQETGKWVISFYTTALVINIIATIYDPSNRRCLAYWCGIYVSLRSSSGWFTSAHQRYAWLDLKPIPSCVLSWSLERCNLCLWWRRWRHILYHRIGTYVLIDMVYTIRIESRQLSYRLTSYRRLPDHRSYDDAAAPW
jgi:hypothetical protein